MSRKASNAYCNPQVEIQWDVFLGNNKTVNALIHFIKGESNNQELRAACRSDACRREVDRMRRLGNHESRERARNFLSKYYSW